MSAHSCLMRNSWTYLTFVTLSPHYSSFTGLLLPPSRANLSVDLPATAVQIKPTAIVLNPHGNGSNRRNSRWVKGITAGRVNGNLQPETEKVKVSDGQSKRREARERWRRAQWTKTDRKTGSPSLIPEGEETNSVCRENEERVRQSLEKEKKSEEAANSLPEITAVLRLTLR